MNHSHDIRPQVRRTGDVIRDRRVELGLSQTELGEKVGVGARQIRRYEAGEQQPLLLVGVALADALRIPITELAGVESKHQVDVSGEWWMAWQTTHRDQESLTEQAVILTQQDNLIHLQTISRGNVNIEEGGYNWRGEARLWDNRTLMGWYVAADGAVGAKGTLFFVLHTHGHLARGIWTGQSHDGDLRTGYGTLARSPEEASSALAELIAGSQPFPTITGDTSPKEAQP